MTRCRACGREIFFARTKRGFMPIDAKPVLGGNVVVEYRHNTGDSYAHVVIPDPNELRYVAHFATCPQSSIFDTK